MEGKVNFFLIAIIAFLSMAVAFIVIYLVITGGPSKTTNEKEQAKIEKKVEIDYDKVETYLMPEMIINLKSGAANGKSIIKVKVAIGIADKKFAEEFKLREVAVQDIIHSTFMSKTGDEVDDITKLEKIKEELLNKFKDMYKEPKEKSKIVKVWIPESFVQ